MISKKYFINTFCLSAVLLIHFDVSGQRNIGKLQPGINTWIYGATVHIGNGTVLQNAGIQFMDGKITGVSTEIPDTVKGNFIYINASGKHIYPGLIAANTILGLNEIDAVRATRDYAEVGTNNANVRSIVAYNADSKIVPTVRSNGVLLAQICPRGSLINGLSSIVQLDAWNWEDASVVIDEGLHIQWPSLSRRTGRRAESVNSENQKREDKINEIEEVFTRAYAYCKSPKTAINLKLESFRNVFEGKRTVFIHTNGAREMITAIEMMENFNVKPVIVGALESYKILPYLKQKNIALLLTGTHILPLNPEDDVDVFFHLPKILSDSGILFGLTDENSWQQRNLPFQAGSAVAYGLSMEDALSSVTLSIARILKIDQNYGSLEEGKSATLLISGGDLLDTKTSVVQRAWIDGREIELKNHQDGLEEMYLKKYFGD